MAQFDAAGDRVSLAAAPDPAAGVTFSAWFRVDVDRDDFSTILRLHSAGGGSTTLTIGTGSDGVTVQTFSAGGAVAGDPAVVGAWHRVAYTITGTDVTLYLADASGPTQVFTGTVTPGATPDGLTIGGRSVGDVDEPFAGTLAHIRLWSGTVSGQAAVEAEWDSASPVRTAGLWADWPLLADLADASGNGRDLAAGTTPVAFVDGPPLPGGGDAALPLDPAAETDTARPLGRHKALTVGTAHDITAARPLARAAARTVTTAAEVTAAGAVGAARTRALAAATEVDAAGPASSMQAAATGGVGMQIKTVMAKVRSVIESLGIVETVNGGPDVHVPGAGLRASVWPQQVSSPPGSSGLDSASVVLTVSVRLFDRVYRLPADEIDADLLDAADQVCNAYLQGFTLGGLVRSIDLHGIYGQRLTVQAGYMDVPDGTCRVMTLTLPLVINDAWEETP